MINVAKFNRSPTADRIPNVSWINRYNKIFDTLIYAVHSRFANLCSNLLPKKMSQGHVPPVCVDHVKRSVERLKSKFYDIDDISAFHLNTDSEELVYHLQLLFQMCLCTSFVPNSFLVGNITSILKRGKYPTKLLSNRLEKVNLKVDFFLCCRFI